MIPLVLGFIGFMLALIPDTPLSRALSYEVNSWMPNKRPEPSAVVEMLHRGLISEEEAKAILRAHGLARGLGDHDILEEYIKIHEKVLTVEEALIAKWRGFISHEEYYKVCKAHGIDEKTADLMEKVRKFYPSATDFIRFAVREVFNEEVVKRFGYDEEFPEGIVEFAEKAGMDKETLKWYWRAHWELPSPTQAYEFLHRLNPEVLAVRGSAYEEMGLNPSEIQFTVNDLRTLLKTADYPKPWRDRLIAISFSPLTRVDLRRIYELGLISDEECLARLMEYGYTRKDAELLLEWFKKEKLGAEKDLTKTEVINAYMMGLMTEGTAKELLKQLGYSDEEAEFLVKLYTQKEQNKLLDEQINTLRELYKTGAISKEEFERGLDSLNLPEAKKKWELLRAERDRLKAIRMPTVAEIQRWLRKGIIDAKTAEGLLLELNVPPEFVQYYIKDSIGGGLA